MNLKAILLALCLIAFAGVMAFADVVVTKDGTKYEGTVVWNDSYIVLMKVDNKIISIQKKDVTWFVATSELKSSPVQVVVSLSMEQAVARITSELKSQLEKSGDKSLLLPPFWGPGEGNVPLHDTLARSVAGGLIANGYAVRGPDGLDKVLTALNLKRQSLQANGLTAGLGSLFGAEAIIVGQIISVEANAVIVQVTLIETETAKTLGDVRVTIDKTPELAKLLGEEPVIAKEVQVAPPVAPVAPVAPQPPVDDNVIRSAISSKFDRPFSIRTFYYKNIANKADGSFEGDRLVWTIESGNKATLMPDGTVVVTSTKCLTEPGQAKALENDLTSIFFKLSSMVTGYTAGYIHKAVEFDSVYYAEKPGVFHRYRIRERDDMTRRNWMLVKNGRRLIYSKMALIIDGSWAKLSVGNSYVVSFGRWTSRTVTPESGDNISVKITPYGWVKYYVAVLDVVTEPGLGPVKLEGWGSRAVEYKTNQLIDHLPGMARASYGQGTRTQTPPPPARSTYPRYRPNGRWDIDRRFQMNRR